MSEPNLLLVLCGDTFPAIRESHGDFELWFTRALKGLGLRVVTWNAHQHHDMPDISFAGVVLSGSPAMVTDRAGWSIALADWILECVELNIPVLGVCYGHQLLADALGGEVDFHPGGREIGSLLMSCTQEAGNDPLFRHMPRSFYAQLSHAQSVLTLPPDAVLLASGSRVRCQAFRYGRSVWGVQFHPEFNRAVMAAYLDNYQREISQAQLKEIREHLHDCPDAEKILVRFADFCLGHKS
ncbi:glutamine amidotransferase [Hahella ganghwensis]|uniref:glutamine amidotransferase n=1 Tax=Hahella ganghwensis TaxID=286420 RepID=UPI000524004C|nr:glutamine amidotransferase [Hahella ganghwensis]